MSDVTLSAAVRQSLLSLQNTTDLVERTQGRLSTGLRVASAIDDPVAFFQAKSLSDRASDFLEKKDAIDQGISTVTAALDGVEGIESIVAQMKGIANSMKSATDAQISDLVTQYNDLRTQLNNLTTDASYQGTNLINGTGQTLSVEFSEQSASLLTIDSVDLTVGTNGLSLNGAAYYTADESVSLSIAVGGPDSSTFNTFLAPDDTLALTYNGSSATFSVGETISFTYGTGSSFDFVVASNAAVTLSNGGTIDVDLVTAATSVASTASFYLLATQTRNLYVSYTADTLSGYAGTALTASTATFDSITLTYLGENSVTLTTADNALDFSDGTNTFTLQLASGTTYTITGASDTLAVTVYTAATAAAALATGLYVVNATAGVISANITGTTQNFGVQLGATSLTAGEIIFTGLVKAGDTTRINAVIDQLDTALTTLRTQSQTLGSNVALLNTRLDFTSQYVNTLQGGGDKLTLADINEEGANLLALQTRQQLGIQSLSLAAQAEASILQLFG